MSDPQPIEIEEAEVERLIDQARQGQLDAAAQQRIVPFLRTLVWLQRTLLETRISLAKLRKILFGKRTEKVPCKPEPPPDGSTDPSDGTKNTSGRPSEAKDANRADTDHGEETGTGEPAGVGSDVKAPTSPPGHGRLGAADYPGAETRFCSHDTLEAGAPCPACGRGRLYSMEPLVRLRFAGQPLVSVTHWQLERLRCGACGTLWVAHMPPEADRETYAVSLKVMLAVAHYHLGLPFKRIESFQNLVGMPLPDATQWELVEQVANSVYPVFDRLQFLGAQQPLVYQDDTGARILSLIKENQADPPPERKAMYTTVLRFEGEHTICLYVTGRCHAGENLDTILAHRDPNLAPIQWMSDALAANTPKHHRDRALDLNCLVHGRRQFTDIDAFFPDQCARVVDAIAKIYEHEAHCKDQQFTAAQRLAYHQAYSAAVMTDLEVWMQQQLKDKLVEPNSRLGGAFDYLLKHWEALTRFLHIPGAPLDNNCAEQALKMILRYRNNSLFYKNEHGAYVGDVLTSSIETCRLNGINPLDYLSVLMHNRSAVFADPTAWLPWTYLETLQAMEQPVPLSHPPPIIGHPGLFGIAVPQ
jgi:hypothetical protein